MLLNLGGLLGLPDRQKARDSLAALADPNRSGGTYGFLAITPIKPGETRELRATIKRVGRGESPFAAVPEVHFARLVVLPDFHDEDAPWQPVEEDRLGCEYLMFSACVDGGRDAFLTSLTERMPQAAQAIWSHCIGVDAASPADLRRYLVHNQIGSGQYYAAYGHTPVAEVRRVLAQQAALRELAVRQYALTPAELQAAFVAQLAGDPR